MKKNNKKFIRRVCIIIVTITFLFVIVEYEIIKGYKRNIQIYNDSLITSYEEQYETIIYGFRNHAKSYFDETINNDKILDIMKKANEEDEDERVKLRKKLNDTLRKTYINATQNMFRQFHFVLKDSTSFLRMHKVEVFGDNLYEIRDSVRLANDEKRYVEGFEEGRIFNGYRFEFPLFKDDEYIGCVETSISFISVVKLMNELFDNPSIFMMKKSVVEEKVFDELIADAYIESRISSLYYDEKESFEYINKDGYIEFLDSLNNDKLKEIDKLLKEEKTFIIKSNNNITYSVVFLKIQNIVENQVGYIIFFNEDKNYDILSKSLILKTGLLLSLWLVILLIIYVFYKSRKEINKILYFDKLTGGYNRNMFYECINQEIARKKRYNIDFSIIMYDIDHFKRVNDIYGHMTGDLVLKDLTNLVRESIRINDCLFRFGGDEFVILLSNIGLEDAKKVAEKIRLKAENLDIFAENITLSLGVVEYMGNENAEEILNRVDIMLYKSKETGRNKISYI